MLSFGFFISVMYRELNGGIKMEISKSERIRGFYEYMFWDVINSYNFKENGNSHIDNKVSNHIMTSEARVLHKRWLDAINANGVDLNTAGLSTVMRSMNTVLGSRIGGEPYDLGTADSPKKPRENSEYKKQLLHFNAITGQTDKDAVFKGDANNRSLVLAKGHYMPVSPYDERFQYREAVLNNGSKLLGIDSNAPIDNFDNMNDAIASRNVIPCKDLHENLNSKNIAWTAMDPKEGDMPMFSDEDYSGLSRLKRFMTKADYDKVRGWVIAGIDTDNMTNDVINERAKALDKATIILSGLQDMGLDYSVSPDVNRGQITANITGTQVRVRVLDTPKNAKYIGKVYDNGSEVRFKSTYAVRNETTGRPEHLVYNPEPKECLDLVKFALGDKLDKQVDGKTVGANGTSYRMMQRKRTAVNKSFHNSNGFSAEYKPAYNPKGEVDNIFGNVIRIEMSHNNRAADTTPMLTSVEAGDYLNAAIDSARQNMTDELNVDEFINNWKQHGEDEDFDPKFSDNPDIAVIQQSYLDILEGRKDTLLKPSVSVDEYEERLSEAGEFDTDSAVDNALYKTELDEATYPKDMDKIFMIRAHASDMVEHDIGTYMPDDAGKRFNPCGVSKWMSSAFSPYRNNDDIVKAMRLLDMDIDEIKGDDFYNKTVKDKLVKFDYDSSKPMSSLESPFMKSMYDEVVSSLEANGVTIADDDSVRIDKNGIIRYSGTIHTAETIAKDNDGYGKIISGEIGQIFEPDNENVVYTHFNSGQNYAFVPGYEARIIAQHPGETKSVEERTKLIGYEQAMRASIRYNLRQDLVTAGRSDKSAIIGEPTSLNSTYSHLYDERHDVDFIQQYKEQNMPADFISTLIKTESQRVRYPNAIRDGSTIHASYMSDNSYGVDIDNDNSNDPFVLTGGRNMSILTSESDGYFDPLVTTATSTNQGVLRYLVDGAKVNADGFITKSPVENDRCALMHDPKMQYSACDPFDRQNMAVSNILDSSSVTDKKAKVAFMNFGGWNMDDGIPISKHFAETHNMRTTSGTLRGLVVGDKTSDFHGNKGVHSIIIDPDMDMEEAKRQGIDKAVAWFKANPELDVVMAPFSAPSRFNGGSGRELLSGNVSDLVSPDGKVMRGGIGEMDFIITDKAADKKTHIYDDDEYAAGNGRRASAQLAWTMNAKNAKALMKEIYGRNDSALANVREYLITCGLDISETGDIKRGYEPHEGEKRNVIEMPALVYTVDKNGKRSGINRKEMSKAFADIISRQGGVMEIPFEMKYPTGDVIPPLNDGKTDVIYTEKEWERKGYTRKDGTEVKATTVHRRIETGKRQTQDVTYGLPVMSSYLRSGQQLADGTSVIHDYTHQYEDIFMAACEYNFAKQAKAHPDMFSTNAVASADNRISDAVAKAQARYDRITNDVSKRYFSGKHNVFRDNLMGRRLPNSATAVWTEDPRLGLGEVAVGRAIADAMNLKDGDYTMVWRDPILRDGGVRCMKAKIDDRLTGIAINPVMDKPFDGDFDGDTVGLWKPSTKAAQDEAKKLFSIEANLLDKGSKNDEGEYDLYLQNGLDIKVAMSQHPELKERLHQIQKNVNSFESSAELGMYNAKELHEARSQAVDMLNDIYKDCFKDDFGSVYVAFDSPEHHIETIHQACVETGAKGSTAKVQKYAEWAGFNAPMKDDGTIDYAKITDNGSTLATRDMQQSVMKATAVKSFGTGIAGARSQAGIKALRNVAPKAVLELTYPVTQSVLQSKHDADEADEKYKLLMGPVQHLWRGEKIERNKNGLWHVDRGSDGKPAQATKGEWISEFVDMYTSSTENHGLNVSINEDYVKQVADALSDDKGIMINIEDEACKIGSPIDRLAYGGTLDTLIDMANNNENLFDGKYSSRFAPSKIRFNVYESEHTDEVNNESEKPEKPKFKSITKSDTIEQGHARNMSHQSRVSVVNPDYGFTISSVDDISMTASDDDVEFE